MVKSNEIGFEYEFGWNVKLIEKHCYLRKVPENKTGSCGIIATRFRRSFSKILAVSTPSIKISPLMQAKRKSAPIKELFPAPVRPTMPSNRIKSN